MTTLRGQGVAVLLAYWAELYPPKGATPGVECSGSVSVLVTAVGYPAPEDALVALSAATAVCQDAGLVTRPLEGAAILVRRAGGVA